MRRLTGEAVDMVKTTDHSYQKGETFRDRAEVLLLAGRRKEALEAVRRSLAVNQAKGDRASAARARELDRRIETEDG